MRVVRLASEIDFVGWRTAARALRAEGVEPPEEACGRWSGSWRLLLAGRWRGAKRRTEGARAFTVPAAFVELAEQVILHRSRTGSRCSTASCGGWSASRT
jgi:hypothetical protein